MPSRRTLLKSTAAALGGAGLARLSIAADVSPERKPDMDALLKRRPLLIAHRGLPGKAPENSIPAFEAALKHAPDVIELDYHDSSDRVPIVLHDKTLDRTTNAVELFGGEKIAVASKTAAEMMRLDSGTWFEPKFAGLKLPTLAEAIDLICPRSGLMIERKGGVPEVLVELIESKQVADRVIVQAFEWEFVAEFRRRMPKVATGLLGDGPIDDAKLEEIRKIGPRVVGWKAVDLDQQAIDRVHQAGLLIWAWTVNEEDRARELVSWGLDGLITNRADVARPWLNSAG